MKNTLLLFLCLALLGNLSAQTFAYHFPGDFDNVPSAFVRKQDGRFLIAGTTGGVFTTNRLNTKGYFLDWDADNGLQNHQLLDIYGETSVLDAIELSNGNIVAAGWDNFCSDPHKILVYVKCFNSAGNLLWATYTDTLQQYLTWPNFAVVQLAERPGDGKVALLFSQNTTTDIQVLDQNNGQTLYQTSILEKIQGLRVNPVNNHLVVVGGSRIIQINPENGAKTEKFDLLPNWDRFSHVLVDAAGTIWAFSAYGSIAEWPIGSNPTVSTMSDIWGAIQWVSHGSGFAELRKTSAGHSIKFFDGDFQLQSITTLPDLAGFNVLKMYLGASTIFLAGIEEHGPSGPTEWKSSNLLIRRFNYDGSPTETEDPDLAVTGITVEVPPVFSEIPGESKWQITGGKFSLTLRNSGSIPVNEAHILSSKIGNLQNDACFVENKRHFSLHLQNLSLAPGEETMVVIDSLNIVTATHIDAQPWELCFWAVAPDQRRDLDLSNDYDCLVFWDVVPTVEPVLSAGIRVLPNPATTAVQILLPESSEQQGAYHILSASGQEMKEGSLPRNADKISIDIAGLPVGVYFVKIGRAFGRFVKI